MRTMQAVLPMRAIDDDGGKLMAATYHRMLGNMPREQISHMAEKAIATCKWFPSIAECIDLASDWRRADEPVRIRSLARHALTRSEASHREERDEWIRKLRRGEPADGIPDWIARYAREHGFMGDA